MARYDDQWCINIVTVLALCLLCSQTVIEVSGRRNNGDSLTACQHLRRAESRRAKSLLNTGTTIRIPRCTKLGDFEQIQCANETNASDCWCVDEYGVEITGTRSPIRDDVNCSEPSHCSASSCRMFCPSGFARDSRSGCAICKCRDPCDDVVCPNGQTCQQQDVKCKSEPCPPVPTCKKARSLTNWCPAGQPLAVEGTIRPFLCGIEPGKPTCPPLYECLVESGNDYGVCCPNSLKYKKPGVCPNTENDGNVCGTRCSHDLECQHMEKCCYSKECQFTCQQPYNVTICHQARALSEILAVNEREGRGYVPNCNGPGGMFSPKQCSRNGLVCWCVDPKSGNKIKGTMGAATMVNCDGVENMIGRSLGRSVDMNQCDVNICAAICEYGFKNDHNGCPTCECSEPCEGFVCPMASHCEIATDPLCSSGSALCASIPICKPDLVYSNPCDFGTPLADNITGEAYYCHEEERQSREYQPKSFFDEDPKESRAMSNQITCPEKYTCTKLHKESSKVCCPIQEEIIRLDVEEERQQSMCEYLRDFSERMEGTEEGMQLALPPPKCIENGSFEARQCVMKKIKVTRNEQRQILEENTIRQMRKLLHPRERRNANAGENLRLYRVDETALNIRMAPIQGRSAKVIDIGTSRQQSLDDLFETDLKKVASASKRPILKDEMVEIEVEECWCVDGFGTEIPNSRGFNVTADTCTELRDSIECLDLTCRMGCEYGFILDPETKCPMCHCRDPCDGISCPEGKECRTVDVSCEGEYCPPVPACLPRKPGQCPFLVPPGSETNACDYECRSDAHCDGSKRCCSNGCGTQCVEPQMKTACQHLQTIQKHQASELGIPAKQTYIAQCNEQNGTWNNIQCGPDNTCWCVNEEGQEISGTRVKNQQPICTVNSAFQCPLRKCIPCEQGYKVDSDGCQTCECRNFCDEISCLRDEECQLISVECIDMPCPKMPICVPRRDSVCPEGNPLMLNDKEILCGPQNENEACPTTHTCQINPMTHRGVCCAKTRDVCFESIESSCLAKPTSMVNTTKWKFSPKQNKCVPVAVSLDEPICHSKNLFHNELACNSVCPVLTQCERLKLKNSLAARRTGQSSVWFQPRCDPITGHWSPIQCLGKQPAPNENSLQGVSRAFSSSESKTQSENGVCWCADKKGAPLKGTLTRELEPICNHRQARGRMSSGEESQPTDLLMEDLIRQMTLLVDDSENSLLNDVKPTEFNFDDNLPTVTERFLEIANFITENEMKYESTKNLIKTTTRCRGLSKTASFPVDCDSNGAFTPTQCNDEQKCWCVDAAGNQLPETETFEIGEKECSLTPIDSVTIELYLSNSKNRIIKNLYEIIRKELDEILGEVPDNLLVHENPDGTINVKFELNNNEKIDQTYAIEEMVKNNQFILGNGEYHPDITLSRFIHHRQQLPIPQATSHITENTFQTIVFIIATGSAFLVSILVVFIMLKRGKKKVLNTNYSSNKILGNGDKYLDYSSPIFVLSANEKDTTKDDDEIEKVSK